MNSPIEHIVVLMLENRSFDHVLGSLTFTNRAIDGIDLSMENSDTEGESIRVHPTLLEVVKPDPLHALPNVREQIAGGTMKGFVRDYETALDERDDRERRRQVMGYLTRTSQPVTYRLAEEYGVSDRWFCSVPAQTWPNRLFVHAATSGGKVTNWFPGGDDPHFYRLTTIYDRLDALDVPSPKFGKWAIYSDHFPQSVVIHSLAKEILRSHHELDSHYRSMRQFTQDCTDGLPPYSFIEPNYFSFFSPPQNDDHPPHPLVFGQQLLADVYLAIRESPSWDSTVLIVTYDEHGGFFDHRSVPTDVPAPSETPAASHESGFTFTELGPRVPTLVIGPRIPRSHRLRPPEGRFFDHTSVIATVTERWGFEPLTARDAAAAPVSEALAAREARRDDDATRAAVRNWRERSGSRSIVETASVRFGSVVDESGLRLAERVADAGQQLEIEGQLNEFQWSLVRTASLLVDQAIPVASTDG